MISWNCYKSACTYCFKNLHSIWLPAILPQTPLLSQILEFASNNSVFFVFSRSLALTGFQTQKEEAELAAFPRWSNFDEGICTNRELNTARNVSTGKDLYAKHPHVAQKTVPNLRSTPKTPLGAVLVLGMLLLRKAIVSPADASRLRGCAVLQNWAFGTQSIIDPFCFVSEIL